MATVRIPTPLRRLTGGQAKVQITGGNVVELLSSLDRTYPGMKERLVDETGDIKRFINISSTAKRFARCRALPRPSKTPTKFP